MKCVFVANVFQDFPGPLRMGCYKSCMVKSEPRKVHIAEIKSTRNCVTYTSVYLRRTFREDGKVKHETLGNLSDLPPDLIEMMRRRLAQVERAFRSMKSIDLHVRPIYHFNDDRIRSHVFLCLLAYYVESHMRDRLRELLFDDPDREATQKSRRSVVAPAARSKSAREKIATLRTSSGFPVQSFQDLLKDLATWNRNTVCLESSGAEFDPLTEATPVQRRIFELLATRP